MLISGRGFPRPRATCSCKELLSKRFYLFPSLCVCACMSVKEPDILGTNIKQYTLPYPKMAWCIPLPHHLGLDLGSEDSLKWGQPMNHCSGYLNDGLYRPIYNRLDLLCETHFGTQSLREAYEGFQDGEEWVKMERLPGRNWLIKSSEQGTFFLFFSKMFFIFQWLANTV